MAYSPDRSQSYILVVDPTSDGCHSSTKHRDIEQYGERLGCPIVFTDSLVQAIATAQQSCPYLVILSGGLVQQWSSQMAQQLRQSIQLSGLIIVAVTDSSELSWEMEYRDSGLDGLFVEPLSPTVLSALSETAIAKHRYLQCA